MVEFDQQKLVTSEKNLIIIYIFILNHFLILTAFNYFQLF